MSTAPGAAPHARYGAERAPGRPSSCGDSRHVLLLSSNVGSLFMMPEDKPATAATGGNTAVSTSACCSTVLMAAVRLAVVVTARRNKKVLRGL